MKTKIFFVIGLALIFITSCTESSSDEFCSNPEAQCPNNSAIEATSCCTNQSCYWIFNGSKYYCDGDDCSSAISQILEKACAGASAYVDLTSADLEDLRAQMQSVTDRLMEQVVQAAGCDY